MLISISFCLILNGPGLVPLSAVEAAGSDRASLPLEQIISAARPENLTPTNGYCKEIAFLAGLQGNCFFGRVTRNGWRAD